MKRAGLILLAFWAAGAGAAERPVIAAKSEIGFTVKQMGVAVSGTFKRYTAKISLDPAKPESASAEIEVEIASISTGTDEGDQTAIDKPWLDAADFPRAKFKSSTVRALGGDKYEVKGALTIRGKPRDATVPLTLKTGADGVTLATGEFGVRRTDFGIGGGEWNEGDLVANDVPVHFRFALGAAPSPATKQTKEHP